MMTMGCRVNFWAWPALIACSLLGCDAEQGEPTQGCDSISDCLLDEICDPIAKICMPERDVQANALLDHLVIGRFSCEVSAPDAAMSAAGLSEVIAILEEGALPSDQGRWTFPTVQQCSVDEEGQLTIMMMGSMGTNKAIEVRADSASAFADRASVGKPAMPLGPDSVAVWDYATGLALAYSISGEVMASGVPTVGEAIQGYLDVTLLPVQQFESRISFGTPCLNGAGDCGAGMEAFCSRFEDTPICSVTCYHDEDCVLGGGQCFPSDTDGEGFCLWGCETDTDCVSPLQCVTQNGASICL